MVRCSLGDKAKLGKVRATSQAGLVPSRSKEIGLRVSNGEQAGNKALRVEALESDEATT